MLKKIFIIGALALCVSTADIAAQSFMKKLEKQGKKYLKEQVEQATKSSSSKSSNSSKKSTSTTTTTSKSTTSTSTSTSSSTQRTYTAQQQKSLQKVLDEVAVLDASSKTVELDVRYVDLPSEHSVFLAALAETTKGTKAPAITAPPSSGGESVFDKWYKSLPGVETLTNQRLVDEYNKLKQLRLSPRQISDIVVLRQSNLKDEIDVRIYETLESYAALIKTISGFIPEEADWVKQFRYADLARVLEDEGYAKLTNSPVAPLSDFFSSTCRWLFENGKDVDAADKQTRTVWKPYGEDVKTRTSVPGVYGEWKADQLVIQGATYFLNKQKMTARVESTNREIAAKTPNYIIPDTVYDTKGNAYIVTELRNGAFSACDFQTITLPSTLVEIGGFAFQDMKHVKKVVVPEKVTRLATCCFQRCTDLEEVYLPDAVNDMGGSNFEGCTKLRVVTLPKTVEKFDVSQFAGCVALESVTLPENITKISDGVFDGCTALKSITIPSSVKSIDAHAFRGCSSLATVNFSEGLEEIGDDAFNGCKMITKLVFPGTLKTIGDDAFKNLTRLASVSVPDSIEEIAPLAFDGCSSLKSVTIPAAFKDDNKFLYGFGYSPIFVRDVGPNKAYIHTR